VEQYYLEGGRIEDCTVYSVNGTEVKREPSLESLLIGRLNRTQEQAGIVLIDSCSSAGSASACASGDEA